MEDTESATKDSGESGKMSPETRERVEGLFADMFQKGLWGSKQRLDPTERELAFRTEGTAIKLFSYLYADDPTNAKKVWQQYAGKPADAGVLAKAEALIIEKNPNKALDGLNKEQKFITDTVQDYLEDNAKRTREKELGNYIIAENDIKVRERNYRRQVMNGLFEQEKEVEGTTLLKSFFKGMTRVSDDFQGMWNERQKKKENDKAKKHILQDPKIAVKDKLHQTVKGAVNEDDLMKAAGATGPGAAAMKMAMKSMADIIRKMSGVSKKDATENSPEQVKTLLLPAPGKHFGGPDMGIGPGLSPT